MSNLFFFRDKKGYTQNDKRERIKVQYVGLDIPVIANAIEKYDLNVDHFENPGKNDLLDFLESMLTTQQYQRLLDRLFQIYGEEGDSFNIKSYNLLKNIDRDILVQKATELRDLDELPENEMEKFDYVLAVEKVTDRDEQKFVDISFNVLGSENSISSKRKMRAETVGGEIIDPQESLTEDVKRWIHEENFIAEVRIYPNANMMAVSNSDMTKTLQGQIRAAIERWGTEGDRNG